MKQAVKKKSARVTRPSISDIKNAIGMTQKTPEDLSMSCADKELSFIPMPEAFVEATKLPGIPQGYGTIVCGWSNTGKSTLKNCLIASCINNGILPVIFETESNFDWKYAIDCGVKATPVYGDVDVEKVDEETGEVFVTTENKIVDYEGDFLYFDTKILCEMYGDMDYSAGKRGTKRRKEAVIEDIAYAINDLLDKQDEGVIMQPMCFIWDSVGSLISYRSLTSKVSNNMWDAGALSVSFNNLLNSRIPMSRKIDSPYTNTFFCVNKIWNDSMNSMGGAASVELKGGRSLFFSCRLILHLGGVAKASVKKLTAVAKGQTYSYGIETKIKVTKNQLPNPFNITYEDSIACVHNGLWSVDRLDAYKKTYAKELLEKLEQASDGSLNASVEDMSFVEEDAEE